MPSDLKGKKRVLLRAGLSWSAKLFTDSPWCWAMSGDHSDSTPYSVSSYMNLTSEAPASSAFWISSFKIKCNKHEHFWRQCFCCGFKKHNVNKSWHQLIWWMLLSKKHYSKMRKSPFYPTNVASAFSKSSQNKTMALVFVQAWHIFSLQVPWHLCDWLQSLPGRRFDNSLLTEQLTERQLY